MQPRKNCDGENGKLIENNQTVSQKFTFQSNSDGAPLAVASFPSTDFQTEQTVLYEIEFCFFGTLNNRNEFTADVHALKATP